MIVHLGCYKTGTSSIQNRLYRMRDSLASAGILYPTTGLHHAEPEVGVRHARLVYAYYNRPEAWQRSADRLVDEIEGSDARVIVLSAEAWANPQHVESLGALVDKLNRHLSLRTRGIIVFRNRLEHARSVYREFTHRRGNVAPFRQFVHNRIGMFDYVQLLALFEGVFDAVEALNYHAEGSLAAAFLSRIGYTGALETDGNRYNPGLTAVEAEVARLMNRRKLRPELDFRDVVSALCARAPELFGGRFAEKGGEAVLQREGHRPKRFRKLSGLSRA
ncbi:MAG: hypothetical protein ACODAC_06485, partial [Pseudomonadota bacterium]